MSYAPLVWLIFGILHLAVGTPNSDSYYASSVAVMQQLIPLDVQLVQPLQDYAKILKSKIKFMRRHLAQMRAKHAAAKPNREQYLSNPLHSYSLLRHMHADWQHWQALMEQQIGSAQIKHIRDLLPKLPKDDDYEYELEGILRLQHLYGISARDSIQGVLNGVQYNAKFSPLETFEIGQFCAREEDYVQAEQWLNATLASYDKLEQQERKIHKTLHFSEINALRLYARVAVLNKNYVEAISAANRGLALEPDSEDWKSAINWAQLELNQTPKAPNPT